MLKIMPAYFRYAYWPSGLAVIICDNRAARRYRRKFKSGCTPIFLYIYIYIYIYLYMNAENPRRASVRAETRTYGTDSPSRQKPRALSITPLHHLQKKRRLNDGLPAHMIPTTRESSEDVYTYTWHTKSMVWLTFFPAPRGRKKERKKEEINK